MNEFKDKMVSAEGCEGKMRPVNVNGMGFRHWHIDGKVYKTKAAFEKAIKAIPHQANDTTRLSTEEHGTTD